MSDDTKKENTGEAVETAPPSPDIFGKPRKGEGVRRLNRIPMMAIGGLAAIVLIVIVVTMIQKANPQAQKAEKKVERPMLQAEPDRGVLQAAPPTAAIPATVSEPAKPAPVEAENTAQTAPPRLRPLGVAGMDSAKQKRLKRQWAAYYQAVAQVKTQHRQMAQAALRAPAQVKVGQVKSPAAGGSSGQPGAAGLGGGMANMGMKQMKAMHAQRLAAMTGGKGYASANGQKSKVAFLNTKAPDNNLLTNTRQAAQSPFEIRSGAVIPAVMVGGINSDLPGQIIGQVTENVYDTATGNYLLIPQGSKLVGTYSNAVTYGQTRVLVAWNRIIFPDGSALDIDMMPGADAGGYAGFNDQVDNHYWRIFGGAMLMSMFSAGVQLSQPQATAGETISTQQTIAAAMGQQLGQVGMALAQRNLNIQPTLKIRPGYKFNVMVTKDMILPPWRGVEAAR